MRGLVERLKQPRWLEKTGARRALPQATKNGFALFAVKLK
jgi:hypothetical protein